VYRSTTSSITIETEIVAGITISTCPRAMRRYIGPDRAPQPEWFKPY